MTKVVFTNGVFDIIHRGHIELLKYAKSLGDYLYVGIDSDKRVKFNKGEYRPIISQEDRVEIISSIKYVDGVYIFNNLDELAELHAKISPDILVKGSDWYEKQIRISDGVLPKTKIVIFNRLGNYSTTNIIKKIK